jgi:glycerol-3-phosphate O-acyltransferase / dihydroxyacetone phosphate acyltransferase
VSSWVPLLAGITFLAVWAAGLIDLTTRRSELSVGRRLAWAMVMLLLPVLGAVAYVLARPVAAAELDPSRLDPILLESKPVATQRGARAVQQVASRAARGLFRSVEVLRPAGLGPSGPQLWCASHFGALSDPIVLLHALARPPRFLAGDFMWRVPVLRRVLDLVRAIPVRRAQDGAGAANREMFGAAADALADADLVTIFPEGVATEGAAVAPLRTGAARIALTAVQAGVGDLVIVPIGIHYQDRAALRHRVFVDVGPPLELDVWLRDHARPEPAGPEDRTLVRALTAELDARLRTVAPQFTDVAEAHALHTAAEVALTQPSSPRPTFGQRAELAADLGRAAADERGAIADQAVGYREALDAAGLSDVEVVGPVVRSRRRVAATLLLGLVLLPFALVGALVHAPLVLLVAAAGRLRLAPPTLATILPVVALVGALVTWGLGAWWLSDPKLIGPALVESSRGRVAGLLVWLLVLPVWGWAALALAERLAAARRALRARRRAGRRATSDVLGMLQDQRAELVGLVERVRASPGTPDTSPLA